MSILSARATVWAKLSSLRDRRALPVVRGKVTENPLGNRIRQDPRRKASRRDRQSWCYFGISSRRQSCAIQDVDVADYHRYRRPSRARPARRSIFPPVACPRIKSGSGRGRSWLSSPRPWIAFPFHSYRRIRSHNGIEYLAECSSCDSSGWRGGSLQCFP
jgi:hypothetical protein